MVRSRPRPLIKLNEHLCADVSVLMNCRKTKCLAP